MIGTATHGWSRDHRMAVLAERARQRTERRALTVLAASCADRPEPTLDEVAAWDRLLTEADELFIRLAAMPPADIDRRRAWRVAAAA